MSCCYTRCPLNHPHVYCPFHGALVVGHAQLQAARCDGPAGWDPDGEVKKILDECRAMLRQIDTLVKDAEEPP